jgi:hypothetical protein
LQPNKFLFVPNLSPSTTQIIAAVSSLALAEAPEVQFVILNDSASEASLPKATRSAAIRTESFHAALQLLLLTSVDSLKGHSLSESTEYETLLDEEFEEQTVGAAFAAL